MSPSALPEAAKLDSALHVASHKPSPVPPATDGGTAGRGRGSIEPVWCADWFTLERLAPRRGVQQ
eukprot:12834026-Alexandrium_andersonii.AAC.1